MKKITAIILAAALCLCLAACGGSNKAKISEDKAKEYLTSIYEANKINAVLKNHEAVKYTVSMLGVKDEEDIINNYMYYETADSGYMETPDISEYKLPERKSYYAKFANGAVSSFQFRAQLEKKYNPHTYQISPEFDGDWFDENHEFLKDSYTSGGLLYINTEYDDVGSKYFITDELSREYDGEIVSTEIIADDETFEIKRITKRSSKTQDEITEIYSVHAEYDVAEPVSARNLRGYFEHKSSNNVNVKLVANPGSADEVAMNYTIPANLSVGYVVDNQSNAKVYTDYACTKQPSGTWDRLSDIERYIKTK